MTRKSEWPEEVPILSARDIHRGSYSGPRGTHCLLGWDESTFFHCNKRVRRQVFKALIRQVQGNSILIWNDEIASTKTEIAAAWNKAMASLGYTEGNPEA